MKSRVALLGLACLATTPAVAQSDFKGFPKPFSAESRESGDAQRVECAGTRCRVTSLQKKGGGAIIVDYKTKATYFVMDDTKQYFQHPAAGSASYFDPCSKMKTIQAEMKQGGVDPKEFPMTCTKTGTVSLKGRSAEKWETHMKGEEKGQHLTSYYDPEIGVVVKREGQGDDFEVSNVKVGGVSEASLQVPGGYAKMTEEQFLKRTQEANRKK